MTIGNHTTGEVRERKRARSRAPPAHPSEVDFPRLEHQQFPWVFAAQSSLFPEELPTVPSLHLIDFEYRQPRELFALQRERDRERERERDQERDRERDRDGK